MLVFTVTSKIEYWGQLGVAVRLPIGGINKYNIYHIVSWLSHKSKLPVKSVPAAEIYAAEEGVDEAKMVAQAYSELFDSDIKLQLCVD